jgi:hypothetical protein
MKPNSDTIESFLRLSEILTGHDDLNRNVNQLYFNKLNELFPEDFPKLLKAFQTEVESKNGDHEHLVRIHLWGNKAYRKTCQTVIRLWYNAALSAGDNDTDWPGTPEAYYEALLWKTIDAHPPGLSGGYFGYWRYTPEN